MTHKFFEPESDYKHPPCTKYLDECIRDSPRICRNCYTWNKAVHQEYVGNFAQKNLHGYGEYVKVDEGNSYIYEGTFYANDFEGYSNIVYLNGDYFEGLFKHNKRYGPGVYTYADGSQNVGLWYGSKLIRLSTIVMGEWVPKLAKSSIAKAKLLKYRKLVPLRQEYKDVAKDMLTELNAKPELVAVSEKLYNPYIRNMNSIFFDTKFYDVEFFGTLDCTIDVLNATSGLLPTSQRHSMVSVESTKELDSSKEIVKGILDYLIDNSYVVENFAELERKQFVYNSIIRAREQYNSELDSNIVNEILNDFMKELDYILSKPNLEKALILKKKYIQNTIPQNHKYDTDIDLKKATVTDLIAWNNEKIFVEILKHVFAHRNKESNVSFSILKLLSGDRSKFNTVGVLEKNCVLFLSHCSLGNENEVIKISNDSKLNPDVCDARGNSGIIFASARDMWRVITILCDLGANLDFVNDEGLTALSICLLRYIALQNDINDWERAFIPDATVTYEEQLQLKQWRPHVSLTNVNMLNTISSAQYRAIPQEIDVNIENYNKVGAALKAMTDDNASISNIAIYEELKKIEIGLVFKRFQDPYLQNPDFKQNYIFNAKCLSQPKKLLTKTKRRQQKEENNNDKSNKKIDFTNLRSRTKKKEDESANFVKQNKLKVVFKTITVLLSCGVDPNLSQVPLPALILAIFCNNMELFQLLLKSTTNLDITSQDEGLSALHMLASLPFTSQNFVMFRMLLNNGANPNIRTNTYHWMSEKERILGKHIFKGEDLGKTPMHILSIRYDFAGNEYIQTEMVKALIENGGSLDNTYLGHTPLTLAILRGNLCLTKFYLESGQVNPYVKLGENIGVATTVLALKRYVNVLPLEKCKAIYDLFTEKNVNPLVEIEGCGNAIEFIEAEYSTEKDETDSNKESVCVSGKNIISNKSTPTLFQLSKGTRFRDRKEKQFYNEETKKYLIECAKHMLEKHIQQQAFKYLKRFIIQNVDFEDNVLIALVKFLPLKDMVRLIQLFIHRGVVHVTPNYFYIVLIMLELSKKHDKTREKKSKNNDLISFPPAIILKKLDWTESDVISHYNMVDPELDTETDKYVVCFYCCKKVGKDLIACPVCGLVYFCCENCNKLSNKEYTVHKCNTLFYDTQKKLRNDALQNNVEYVISQLDEKLGLLDAILREKYPYLGVSDDLRTNDFDKLSSIVLDTVLEDSTNFLEKVRTSLTGNDLLNLEEDIKQEELVTQRHKNHNIFQSKFDTNTSKGSYQKKLKRGKSKGKDASSKEMKTITTNISTENVHAKQQGKRSKHKRESVKDSRKSSRGGANWKQQADTKSSEHEHQNNKHSYRRSISRVNIIRHKDKSRRYSKENKSGKHAVYKHDISVSYHTKSMKDKYNLEQIKCSKNYEDQAILHNTLLNDKFTLASVFDKLDKDILNNFSRLPHKCQFLIERLSELFPGIDFSQLFWPYACYVDGQLYYRFLEERPVFLETYSNL